MVDARPAERPEGAVGATSWHSPPVSALLEVDRLRGERRCDWLTPDASDAGARPLPSPLFYLPEEAASPFAPRPIQGHERSPTASPGTPYRAAQY